MARSRVIKPEFWSDEKLAMVDLPARLLYIGLRNTCDDAGRSKGHPLWLKSQIFPYDDLPPGQIERWLSDLAALRRILPYTVNGEQYYFIPGFLKHQKIQHPSPARNPAPPPELHRQAGTNGGAGGNGCVHKTAGVETAAGTGEGGGPAPTHALPNASGEAHEQTETEAEAETETETEDQPEAGACAAGAAREEDAPFAQFWKAYPRKQSKGLAEKVWARLRPDAALLAQILAAIDRARASPDWQRDGGKYIPYPANWLNAKGWEDETGHAGGGRRAADAQGVGGGASYTGPGAGRGRADLGGGFPGAQACGGQEPLFAAGGNGHNTSRIFTGPEPLRDILVRHGLDPVTGQFPDGSDG